MDKTALHLIEECRIRIHAVARVSSREEELLLFLPILRFAQLLITVNILRHTSWTCLLESRIFGIRFRLVWSLALLYLSLDLLCRAPIQTGVNKATTGISVCVQLVLYENLSGVAIFPARTHPAKNNEAASGWYRRGNPSRRDH